MEGAVLLVPSVVESVPRSVHEVLDDALTKFGDYSGDLDGVETWDEDPAHGAAQRNTPH